MISQGVGVGLGSAARNTHNIDGRKCTRIGQNRDIFERQYYYCHTLIIAKGPCLHLFGSELVRKQL